jgi:hypothetical protein
LTIPGSEGHALQDATTFIVNWGVDYIKADWCGNVKEAKYGLPRGKKYHVEFRAAVDEAIAVRDAIPNNVNRGRPVTVESVAGFWFTREDVGSSSDVWRFCEDHHDKLRAQSKTSYATQRNGR